MAIEISNVGSRLTITYRPRKSFQLYFLCIVWSLVLFSIIRTLPTEFAKMRGLGDVFFGVIFLIFFAVSTTYLAYRLMGRTQLNFGATELNVANRILGFGSESVLSLENLPEPYFVEEDHEVGQQSKTPSFISFDFPNGRFTCCSGIAGDEAYEIIEAIRKTFPELAQRWGTGAHLHSRDIATLNLL